MNIAEHYCDARDFPKAMECYRDALAQDPDNVAASLALANLHISTGELEECQNICSLLLQKNPQDEKAIVVLANVLFQRSQHTEAIHHFQQLLKKRPDNFTALSTLIDLLRRAGKAEESTRFLEMAFWGLVVQTPVIQWSLGRIVIGRLQVRELLVPLFSILS